MILNPDQIGRRERLVLAGLYLAEFDTRGLQGLGFQSFAEAYNVIGYALGSQPASIKNYRDEFDPLFPNRRKGWHKRPTRDYCLRVFHEYKDLDFDLFRGLIQSFVGYDENHQAGAAEGDDEAQSGFAKRLITGLAAEQYFESVQPNLQEFRSLRLENTTRLGCGYDFRLHSPEHDRFWAVEVKGLRELSGSVSLTPREYEAASEMRGRYFLFVVKNFQKSPYHEIFLDPISGKLEFARIERIIVQVSWSVRV